MREINVESDGRRKKKWRISAMALSPESSFAVKIGEEETGGTPGDLSRFSQGFQAELEESVLITAIKSKPTVHRVFF
jgi:hypothetical protein